MGKFSYVNIDSDNRKVNEHDLSHVVNTTSDFGTVFPINCQIVPIKSTVQLAVTSLVRLDPLLAPSFGSVHQEFTHTIVPTRLLYPYYDNVILHTPVSIPNLGTVTPAYLPRIGSFSLTLYLLAAGNALVSCYRKESSGKYVCISDDDWDDIKNFVIADFLHVSNDGAAFLISKISYTNNSSLVGYFVDPAHADFSIKGSYDGSDYFLTFNFSNRYGCLLYKYFLACGYKPTLNYLDDYDVCILPLMACAKSYFDSYRIAQYDNYKDSPVYKLYSWYLTNLPTRINIFVDVSPSTAMYEEHLLFVALLEYLALAFYTEDCDFVSAHLPRPDLPAYDKAQFNSFNYLRHTGYGADVSANFNTSGQTAAFTPGNNSFGQLDDELLKIMYYSANKTSQSGYVLATLLRERGYDTYVDECNSSFIGRDMFNVNIRDVTSLAETLDVNGNNITGSALGDFAGMGVEQNSSQIYDVEITEPSYVVTLCSVTPLDGYMGTLDKTVLGVDQFSCYNPTFDGFGYEISPKSVYGKFDSYFRNDAVHDKASFGVIPRYSSWKHREPLVMGNMIRPQYSAEYQPYCLQKQVLPDTLTSSVDENGKYTINESFTDSVPTAGKSWRMPLRYPWLTNFNRIFRNSDYQIFLLPGGNAFATASTENIVMHNFMHFKSWNKMLAIADTFETIDKDKLNSGQNGDMSVDK